MNSYHCFIGKAQLKTILCSKHIFTFSISTVCIEDSAMPSCSVCDSYKFASELSEDDARDLAYNVASEQAAIPNG